MGDEHEPKPKCIQGAQIRQGCAAVGPRDGAWMTHQGSLRCLLRVTTRLAAPGPLLRGPVRALSWGKPQTRGLGPLRLHFVNAPARPTTAPTNEPAKALGSRHPRNPQVTAHLLGQVSVSGPGSIPVSVKALTHTPRMHGFENHGSPRTDSRGMRSRSTSRRMRWRSPSWTPSNTP